MTDAIAGSIITGIILIFTNIMTFYLQYRKMQDQAEENNKKRADNEVERDARAAKDVGEALTSVTDNLQKQMKMLQEQLETANKKIEHLTLLVEEYSRGVDLLVDQLKKMNEVPVYTKKHSAK